MIKYLLIVPCALAAASSARAAENPARCLASYADHARGLNGSSWAMWLGGRGLQLGATTAGSSYGLGWVASTAGVLGGSTLGTSANRFAARAQFVANVGQSAAESRGRVVGPVTTRLAADLNDAIYGWGAFFGAANPLAASVRSALRTTLGGRRLSAADVAQATARLLESGDLCDAQGRPLGQDAWATIVVGDITGTRLY